MEEDSLKKKVAVFDLDGTVFRSSLFIELLEKLIAKGIFPPKTRRIYERQHLKWLDRKGSFEDYLSGAIRAHDKFIKGAKAEEVWQAAKEIITFHKNRTYRFTRDLISNLKKTHYLLAISSSPREIVKLFGKELGFDKTYSYIFEVNKKGCFTGKVVYEELIRDKGKILKRAIKKGNLTLKDSIGLGDTENDISFLKQVQYPIAFNPNLRLYEYASRKNWPIIVERKDVIYKIGGKNLPLIAKTI